MAHQWKLCWVIGIQKESCWVGAAYIKTYIQTYKHTYIYANIHTYIHTFTYTYIHTSINIYTQTYVHKNMHTKNIHTNKH